MGPWIDDGYFFHLRVKLIYLRITVLVVFYCLVSVLEHIS